MTELQKITQDNFLDAFALRLDPGQEEYVSHPVRSLAQAYVYRDQCQPFGETDRIALTCHKGNAAARKLNESRGFAPTGNTNGDEIEMAMAIGQAKGPETFQKRAGGLHPDLH